MEIDQPARQLARHARRPRLTARLILVTVLVGGLVVPTAAAAAATRPRIFAYYYVWWSRDHWHTALGPHYPYSASPLPLPARLGAGGCPPHSRYAGNTLTDVPGKLWGQDNPATIARDVRDAVSAGLSGFIVNWAGTGQARQGVRSIPYSRRLQLLVNAVHAVRNRDKDFSLWLGYKASAEIRSTSAIRNDLAYFVRKYGRDPAFDRSQDRRATVIWQGSRKYPTTALATVSRAYRTELRILGDESTWSRSRARYLAGDAYYWSSQNPYDNPQSFGQLAALARRVRSGPRNPNGTRKIWIAPFAPGFDTELAGGSSCVPRMGTHTLRRLFDGNLRTHPSDWALISWNEITEATYVMPLRRYGRQSLDMLHTIVTTGH
jgi:hypothetical protein